MNQYKLIKRCVIFFLGKVINNHSDALTYMDEMAECLVVKDGSYLQRHTPPINLIYVINPRCCRI